MRKEVIIAVILGLLLGSLLVYGLYTANSFNQTPKPSNNDQAADVSPTPSPTALLTIITPQDGDVIEDDTITLTGQVSTPSTISVITEKDEFLFPTKGSFSQEIKLVKGGNLIKVTAITESGQKQDEFINLVYTSSSTNTKTDE